MNILIDIGHPAHVHFFKNFIREMENRGHKIVVNTVNKEITLDLLEAYNIEYILYGKRSNNLLGHFVELIKRDYQIYKIQKKYDIDIIVGISDMFGAHVSKITKADSIVFTDTEHAKIINILTQPFASIICTPSCYQIDIGKKQFPYNGYHELAYLHPNHFCPDSTVLDELGLTENDPFIILRFVSWNASHDVGQHGISDKVGLVKKLENYGRVLITSEGTLPKELQPYQIQVSPDKLHDLLYYATLYVGEGGTTAAEAAVLGTPSIFVSSLAGTMGNFIELEETYDLLYSFTDSDAALFKAREILQNPARKEAWRIKFEHLLKDKIDVTAFMVWFIENYPQSTKQLKENPDFQNKF